MALSEQKLRELAEIEPPRFLERIADFLADLTLRTSGTAVLERDQEGAGRPIGSVGLQAESFGMLLSHRAAFHGVADPVHSLYRLMRPYQIGPYELRQFTMWLVKFHDKLSETEALRVPPVVAAAPRAEPARPAVSREAVGPAPSPPSAFRLPAVAGAGAVGSETELARGSRRRVGIVRRPGTDDEEVVEEVPAGSRRVIQRPAGGGGVDSTAAAEARPAASQPTREPDVISRAWQAGHRSGQPAGIPPEVEVAPSTAKRVAMRTLWLSNLSMASAAAGVMIGRSVAPATMAARLTSPATLGVAGPAATGSMLQPPYMSFPLSHPPVSTASWLGVAPPAPYPADFVPMPGAPAPLRSLVVPQPAFERPSIVAMPSLGVQMPVLPGREALSIYETAHQAYTGTADVHPLGRPRGTRGAVEDALQPTAEPSIHPSPAPQRGPSPIPGLLAAGLAGFLLGRLTSRGGGQPVLGPQVYDLFAEPVPSRTGVPRLRIFSPSLPGSLEATLVASGAGPTAVGGTPGGAFLQVGIPLLGAGPSPGRGLGTAPGMTVPSPMDILGGTVAARRGPATSAPIRVPSQVLPRLGEVTLVAPPIAVASEAAERRGSAVAFDWKALARASGPLDQTGLRRLREALPEGTQAIYPAIPRQDLPAGAVNLRLAPSLLRPLLTQAYGSHAAGIAGAAASTASALSLAPLPAAPMPARILPVRRPAGAVESVLPSPTPSITGALEEAGAGQARRSPMLDFLGVPVRLAPSLAGRAELRDELAARGVATQGATPQVVRPHLFQALREQVFPGVQAIQAEPDRSAWRKAAPHFGLRDSEPTTVLSPDARVKPPRADAPLPQLHTGAPSPVLRPWLAQTVAERSAGAVPMSLAAAPWLAGAFGMPSHRPPHTAGRVSEPRLGMDERVEPFASPMTVPMGVRGVPSVPAERPIHALWPTPEAEPRSPQDWSPVHLPPVEAHGRLRVPEGAPAEHSAPPAPLFSMRGALLADRSPLSSDLLPSLPGLPARPAMPTSELASRPFLPSLRTDWHQGIALPGARPEIRPAFRSSLPMAISLPRITQARHPALASDSLPSAGTLDTPTRVAAKPTAQQGVRPLVSPAPFGVPMLAPIPLPIFASTAQRPALGTAIATPTHQTLPTTGKRSSEAPAALHLTVQHSMGGPQPTALPSMPMDAAPLPLPTARVDIPPVEPPPMFLPGAGEPTSPVALPSRASSVVSHAPRRYYASVDAGPARRLAVQKATSETAGIVGGPHQPLPSPHRARQMPADTQRASILSSREEGMTANEVFLLANDVWAILKRRLQWEADRRGRW